MKLRDVTTGGAPPVITVSDHPGNTLGLRTTAEDFDYSPSARCVSPRLPLLRRDVRDAAECQALCAATQGCNAAQLNHAWTDLLSCSATPPPVAALEEEAALQGRNSPEERARRQRDKAVKAARLLAASGVCLERPQCELHAHCLERTRAPAPARSGAK